MGSGVATAPMHLPCTSHASHRSLLFPTISTHYTTYYLLLRSLLFPTVLQQTHTEIAPSSVLWVSRWVSVLLLCTHCRMRPKVPPLHSALARSSPRALATGRCTGRWRWLWRWLACSLTHSLTYLLACLPCRYCAYLVFQLHTHRHIFEDSKVKRTHNLNPQP